jgi:xanthine/uracil permease
MPEQNRSIMSLISDLARETTTLVRDEVQLAKAEVSEKVDQVGDGITSLLSGGIIVFSGVLVLLYAVVVVVADLISGWTTEPWVAPLIVGLVVSLIGLGVLAKGRNNLKASHLRPQRTQESLQRNRDFMRGHTK